MSGRRDAPPREDAMRGPGGSRWSWRRCVREEGSRAGGAARCLHAPTEFRMDHTLITASYISGFGTELQEKLVFTHNVCGSLSCPADKGSDIYTQRAPQKPLFTPVCTALLHCSDSCAPSRRFVVPLLLSTTSPPTWSFNLAWTSQIKEPRHPPPWIGLFVAPNPQPCLPPLHFSGSLHFGRESVIDGCASCCWSMDGGPGWDPEVQPPRPLAGGRAFCRPCWCGGPRQGRVWPASGAWLICV